MSSGDVSEWEFDSIMEITEKSTGHQSLHRVWSRPSLLFPNIRDWAITPLQKGVAHPPTTHTGYWPGLAGFVQYFPHFDSKKYPLQHTDAPTTDDRH
jgi:hypothetical protein